jgi:CheY-like chemotaxis protein
MSLFKILVVDDQEPYRLALKLMYEGILGKGACMVDPVGNATEAKDRLKSREFDLLSLDINLGEDPSVREDDDRYKRDANGLDVLRYAANHRLVKGVIIFTAAQHDEQLQWVVGKGKLAEVLMHLREIAADAFPDRNAFADKLQYVEGVSGARPATPSEQVEALAHKLTAELVHHIARPWNPFPAPYSLKLDGRYGAQGRVAAPRVILGSTHPGVRKTLLIEGERGVLLQELARKTSLDENASLSKGEIVKLTGGKDGQNEYDSLVRWLTRKRLAEDGIEVDMGALLKMDGGMSFVQPVEFVFKHFIPPPYTLKPEGDLHRPRVTISSNNKQHGRGKQRLVVGPIARLLHLMATLKREGEPLTAKQLIIAYTGQEVDSSWTEAKVALRAEEIVSSICDSLWTEHEYAVDPDHLLIARPGGYWELVVARVKNLGQREEQGRGGDDHLSRMKSAAGDAEEDEGEADDGA